MATVAQTPPQDTAKKPSRDVEFRLQARAVLQEAVETALERLSELHEARRSGGPVEIDRPTGEHLLRPKAAARFLGLSERRFYDLKRQPDFPSPVLLPGKRHDAALLPPRGSRGMGVLAHPGPAGRGALR